MAASLLLRIECGARAQRSSVARLAGNVDLGDDLLDGGASTLGLTSWPPSTELSYWRTRPVVGVEVVAVSAVVDPIGRTSLTAELVTAADATPGLLRLRLATLLVAQLFDFGTFTVMVARHGAVAEANPLVAQGLIVYGVPLLALVKAALVVLLGSIVVILGRPDPRRSLAPLLGTGVALLAVGAGLLGGLSNVLVFID
jgi:hypothetical protein